MKKYSWLVVFFLVFVLQLAIKQSVYFKFDLPLIAVYAYAMVQGSAYGSVLGAVYGLLQDLLCGSLFGFHIATRVCVGYITGYIKEQVFKEHAAYHLLAAFCFTVGVRTALLLASVFLTNNFGVEYLIAYAKDTLAYCLGNMLLVIPMYRAFVVLSVWEKKID